MADRDDREEPASPSRQRQAREDGRVPMSGELVGSAGVFVAFLWFSKAWPSALDTFAGRFEASLGALGSGRFGGGEVLALPGAGAESLTDPLVATMRAGLGLFLPLALLCWGGAVSAGLLQTRALVRTATIIPDLNRLAPAFERFRPARQAKVFAVSVARWLVVGVALVVFVGRTLGDGPAPALLAGDLGATGRELLARSLALGTWTSAVLLVIALLDALAERLFLAGELRMSRGELEAEASEDQVSPELRRRQEAFRQRLLGSDSLVVQLDQSAPTDRGGSA